MRLKLPLFIVLLSLCSLTYARTYSVEQIPNVQVANASRYTSNPDGILSEQAVEAIDRACDSLHTANRAQIAVVAVEDIEGYISVDDEYLGDGEYFALTASGSSMKDVGIDEGDIVYIKRQMTAENGDIVAAIISDEITGESIATLKRFYKDEAHKRFILHPENREMSDIIVKDVSIVGIAVRVLKNLRNK